MFTEKQIERMLGKLERFEAMLEPRIFSKVAEAVSYTHLTLPTKLRRCLTE